MQPTRMISQHSLNYTGFPLYIPLHHEPWCVVKQTSIYIIGMIRLCLYIFLIFSSSFLTHFQRRFPLQAYCLPIFRLLMSLALLSFRVVPSLFRLNCSVSYFCRQNLLQTFLIPRLLAIRLYVHSFCQILRPSSGPSVLCSSMTTEPVLGPN